MRLRYLLIAFVGILFLILISAFILAGAIKTPFSSSSSSSSTFSLSQFGSAGNSGYAVFNYNGPGNVTLISYPEQQIKKVFIVRDSHAVDDSRFTDFYAQIKVLEGYGYNVTITNSSTIGQGIYIIPSGAMPNYVLTRMSTDLTNLTIIYIGAKDLIISGGLKKSNWYDSLSPYQRSHVIQYDGTLNQFLSNSNRSLSNDILYLSWEKTNLSFFSFVDKGTKTITTPSADGNYLRLIYNFESSLHGTNESKALNFNQAILSAQPDNVFPGEISFLEFSLNKTNGTAYFSVKKNGIDVEHDLLSRVTDQNVFIQKLQFNSPGDYVLSAGDNSGTIANGILHVKDLSIRLISQQALQYVFSVTLDGQPVDSTDVMISVGNSTNKKKFFVNSGTLVVAAKLDQGPSTLNMDIFRTTEQIQVINNSEATLDFYVKYGIPGLLLVLIVYFGATFSRRPSYKIKFGEGASYIRDEVHISVSQALSAFKAARTILHLKDSPITPHEFVLALKSNITGGADITEGNVEGVLKTLVNKDYLENHRQYYQLKGEGSVQQNVLRRMIKEKLIENGISFKEAGNKFIAKDFEVGFYGDSFSQKAILVVDDDSETRTIVNSLSDSERAKLRIMQSNNRVVFVSIDHFGDIL